MAAGQITVGRRLASEEGAWAVPEQPGDYCGPVPGGGDGSYEVCYFLLPIARDDDAPPGARSIHSVHFPPHTYRECEDGSLEIRASILAYGYAASDGGAPAAVWHGYLDEGHVWREV